MSFVKPTEHTGFRFSTWRRIREQVAGRPEKAFSQHRGIVAVQVAVALTVMLGFAALAIDIGRLHLARGELQRAADASVMAGASGYLTDAGLLVALGEAEWSGEGELATIINSRAQEYAEQNPTLGDGTILELEDAVKGTYDFDNPSAPLDTSGGQRFNALQITVKRTSDSSNGPIPYLFAPILGKSEGGVLASAIAALDDRFGGYKQTEEYGLLIPFTIHEDIYYDMIVNGPDDFSYDEATETVSATGDGVSEITLFPWKLTGSSAGSGNFGLLHVGNPGGGLAKVNEQINHGIAPADLEAEVGTSELTFVDSGGDPITYDVSGDPGMKRACEAAVLSRMGEIVGFFLHDYVTFDGAVTIYRIVDLRFGRVMHIDLTGAPSTKRLVLQPVAYTGPGVIVIEDAPSSDGQVGVVVLVR